MNSTTFSEFKMAFPNDRDTQNGPQGPRRMKGAEPPLVVQILSVIAFGIFGIVAIALAFAAFWVAGLVLAVIIAWTWAGNRTFGGRHGWRKPDGKPSFADVTPASHSTKSSGNSWFDAYRADMLRKLEQESADFDSFLARLRAARDATEFDQFMEERANTTA